MISDLVTTRSVTWTQSLQVDAGVRRRTAWHCHDQKGCTGHTQYVAARGVFHVSVAVTRVCHECSGTSFQALLHLFNVQRWHYNILVVLTCETYSILYLCCLYKQIRQLIYMLCSQVRPPLLLWRSGTEHIYTESGSRDVWVNHGRQSPPPTGEGVLCECASYSFLKHSAEIGCDTGFFTTPQSGCESAVKLIKPSRIYWLVYDLNNQTPWFLALQSGEMHHLIQIWKTWYWKSGISARKPGTKQERDT